MITPVRDDRRELRNHFLGDAFAEVVLLVATKIFKWQHDQHDSLGLRCGSSLLSAYFVLANRYDLV